MRTTSSVAVGYPLNLLLGLDNLLSPVASDEEGPELKAT